MKKLSPRIIAGIFGLLATAVVFLWFVFGWLNITTSLLDVFGVEGLRIPAGIAIGGLLTAAVGFNKF